MLGSAQRNRHQLVYLDEAHVHQDVDLGHGWGERGKRFFVASNSPGLSAKVSFYGLYLYNEGQVRLWPYARANGEHTIDVLRRLRAEIPNGKLIVIWDGAPYHRAKAVWAAAVSLGIELAPLPGYSPDLMPVEGRGSNQGNTKNEKSLYHQLSIDFRCYLEMALFEPRPNAGRKAGRNTRHRCRSQKTLSVI